jgi:cell division protein FtsA
MYATSVGLVLSGYRSLDDRMTRYTETRHTESRTNEQRVVPNKQNNSSGGDFFKKILDRTKGLLIDDFDDKQNY